MSAQDEGNGVKGTAYSVIPEWILDAEISDRAVRLFGVLGRYVGANENAWPSRRTLAERLACSVDTLDRALRDLVSVGAVVVEHRNRPDGSLTSSLYWLWPRLPAATSPEEPGHLPAAERLPLPARLRQEEGTSLGRNLKEVNTRTGSADDALTFDRFWQLYPKRNGKRLGKRTTEERWWRLTVGERAFAEAGAKNYAQAVEQNITIAKDPERWLRGRCWEDWQTPATPNTRGGGVDLDAIAEEYQHRDTQEGERP